MRWQMCGCEWWAKTVKIGKAICQHLTLKNDIMDRMKSLLDESLALLKQILQETENGFRLRSTTRMKIRAHIGFCEETAKKFEEIYKDQWAEMGLPPSKE